MAGLFSKLFSEEQRELASLEKMADKVISYEPEMQKLSVEELADKTTEYKERLANGETIDDILYEAFATAREMAYRQLGEKPYKVKVFMLSRSMNIWLAVTRTGWGESIVL